MNNPEMKPVSNDEFNELITGQYLDVPDFVEIYYDEIVEMFETGSALLLIDGGAFLVEIKVSKRQ